MPHYKNKLFICSLIIGSLFLVLFLRLFYLQILKGDEFELFSIENRIRLINSPAPRGKILDRNNKKIVVNRPSFDLKVFPNELKNIDIVSVILAGIIDMDKTEIEQSISRAKSQFATLMNSTPKSNAVATFLVPDCACSFSGVFSVSVLASLTTSATFRFFIFSTGALEFVIGCC